ncbi:hypothetical protein K402DRAFT_67298 [Aulographum hederae CBS 113979]|uniref:Mediator complex subunit 15 KIX domain-containing protein n=1 Tax=Aulographum hederae CBS 113979 TaxID=1176131 RepID=A0A6G1H187_9PEZI|nr:hypothetical protein K402DRAFT_67298 [Aulographum hederae CBS 113979]
MNNPNNMQNGMGGQGQAPAGASNNNIRSQLTMHFTRLQSQQSGFAASIAPAKRVGLVWEIISSLRLARPQAGVSDLVQRAMGVEEQCLRASSDENIYSEKVRAFLQNIHAQRQQRAGLAMQQQMNQGMMQQRGMMPQNQHQNAMSSQPNAQFPQPAFPPQLQHQMQPSPIPNNPQNPPSMPENQPSAQPMQNQLSQQAQNGQQVPQQRRAALTPQEQMRVHQIAQTLAQRVPENEKEALRQSVAQKIAPAKLMSMRQNGMDLLVIHFLPRAQEILQTQRNNAMMNGMNNTGPQNMNFPGMPNSDQSQKTVQNQANTMNPPGSSQGGQPDFNFAQMASQQADAMRLQEAGGQVVPATQHPLGMGQMGMQQGQNGLPQNMPGQRGQPMMNLQQNQHLQAQAHARAAQAQAAQAQAAQAQAARQQAAQMNLRGQVGGLNSAPPQQSPAMPLLTTPLAVPNQHGSATPQPRPQSVVSQVPMPPAVQPDPNAMRAMQMAQQRHAAAQGNPMAMQGNRRQIPPQLLSMLPPASIQKLQSLDDEGYKGAIQRLFLQHQNRMAAGQQPGLQTGQQGNAPPTHFQTGPGGMQQNMMQRPQPQMSMMGQQLPQQQNMNQQQAMLAAAQARGIPPEIIAQMNQRPFPRQMLSNSGFNPPQDITTWGQLREWAIRNPQPQGGLDAVSIEKMQRMHFLHMTKGRMNPQMNAMNAGQNLPGQPSGPAPQANMVPGGMMGNQMQQHQNMGGQQGAVNLVNPSPSDIQLFRMRNASTQPQLNNLNDDDLRKHMLLVHQRNQQVRNQMQQQQQMHQMQQMQQQHQANQRQQQQQQMPQQLRQPFQPGPNANIPQQQTQPQPQRPQGAQPQPQPQQTPSVNKAQPMQTPNKQAQAPAQPAPAPQNQKKRPIEDVVEIPNPNAPAPQAPAMQPSRSQQRPGIVNEQNQTLTPQQRAHMAARGQGNLAAQQGQGVAKLPPIPAQLKARYQELAKDVEASIPTNAEVPIAPQMRAHLNQKLQGEKRFIESLETCALRYLHLERTEKSLMQLLQIKTILFRQIHQTDQGYQLNNSITFPPQEIERLLDKIHTFVATMLKKLQSMAQAQSQGDAASGQTAPAPQAEAPQQQPLPSQQTQQPPQVQQPQQAQQAQQQAQQQLNASNLEQQQQMLRNTPAQHKRTQSKPPPAPTSTHPPHFPLGHASPQGVPLYGGPAAAAPLELKQPPKKKARTGQSTVSTPAQPTPPSSSPQVGKVISPKLQRQQPPAEAPKPTFICPHPECFGRSFNSQPELDSHAKDNHVQIDDPLKFAHEVAAKALGLNPDGTSKRPVDQKVAGKGAKLQQGAKVPALGKDAVKIKQEATTPMARVGTQTSMGTPSKASPAARQQPQAGTKAGAQAGAAVKEASAKAETAAQKQDVQMTDAVEEIDFGAELDAWQDSEIKPGELADIFAELNNFTPEVFKSDWALRPTDSSQGTSSAPSTSSPSAATPASTATSKNSDINEGDQLNLNMTIDGLSDWFAKDAVLHKDLPSMSMDAQYVADLNMAGVVIGPDEIFDMDTMGHIDLDDWDGMFGKGARGDTNMIAGWEDADMQTFAV